MECVLHPKQMVGARALYDEIDFVSSYEGHPLGEKRQFALRELAAFRHEYPRRDVDQLAAFAKLVEIVARHLVRIRTVE